MGRNIWLTIVTVTILILALFSVNLLITVNVISEAAINAVREKIDVTLFLTQDAPENDILSLKANIGNFTNVREVVYISKEDALIAFKAKHKDNRDVLSALNELGANPLTPSLIIKPADAANFDGLIERLDKTDNDIIASKNFDDHKTILGKINSISEKVNEVGLIVSAIFTVITLLVVYNSIRVAIYTHRREITIMRLVGASNWFIKGPYLVSCVFYAIIGVAAVAAVYFPFLNLLQPYLEAFFIDYRINIVSYFYNNIIAIFGFQFLGAVFINFFASIIAVGKYSKV